MEKLITIKLTKAEVQAVIECSPDAESEVAIADQEKLYDMPNVPELFSSVMCKIVQSIPKAKK